MGEEVSFKGYAPEQGELLPSHLGEALDPSDPVFFVSDVVESLDLEAFEARYAVRGEHAYPPRLLLTLWLFGAIAGVYSGREIARRVNWDLRFRYLAGGLRPDFRTINRFRVRHREDFGGVFRETVRLAQASGMVQLGRLAIDGSKIRVNTSRHRAMSHKRMREAEARLEDELGQILMQMEEVNEEEDEEHGEDDGSGGLPEELRDRKRRLERIRKARLQLETEKGDGLQERHQKSFTDPEANMMMTAEGALDYCYNSQIAVSEEGIVVGNAVANTVRDLDQLEPMLEEVQHNTGEPAGVVLADHGYFSEDNLVRLRKRGQRALIAAGREGKKPPRWPRGPASQHMHRLLRLPWARALYRYRKTQGERPFAEIKARMRFRRFSLRGQPKVTGEWDLVCAALNLKTLWGLQTA